MSRRALVPPAVVAALWALLSPLAVGALASRTGALADNTRDALLALRWVVCGAAAPLALAASLALAGPGWLSPAAHARLARGLARLALLAGAAALSCLAAEIAVRALRPERPVAPSRLANYRPSADPELVYELVPGTTCTHDGIAYRVNAAGFRGPEWPAGRCALMVVGDSLVFGDGCPEERLFWRSLSPAPGSFVAGLGVGGYATFQERRLVDVFAPRLAPERVLVMFCMNDVDDPYWHVKIPRAMAFPPGALPDPSVAAPPVATDPGEPAAAPSPAHAWGAADLLHHVLWRFSALFRGAARLVAVLRARAAAGPAPAGMREPWVLCLTALSDPGSPRARWLGAQLAALAASGARLHVPVGVLVAPCREQLEPGARFATAPQATVAALCRAAGLPCLDLTAALAPHAREPLFVDACHFAPRGHELVRDAVASWLAGGGLRP